MLTNVDVRLFQYPLCVMENADYLVGQNRVKVPISHYFFSFIGYVVFTATTVSFIDIFILFYGIIHNLY